MFALYATIWISLVLFVASEAGRSRWAKSPGWPWLISAVGAVFLATHIALAMSLVHNWSHASTVAATAAQTEATYGLSWGGGVFVNYLFLAVWIAELTAWRSAPAKYAARSRSITWTVRAFFFIVIANGAIVFATGWRKALGTVLVLVLVASWRPGVNHS